MAVSEFRFSSWGTGKTSTGKSRKFEVIGTRDFIVVSSNYMEVHVDIKI